MVKLFCAVNGATGSAFSVRMDESDTVDDLKKAIKKEKSRTIKCDADQAQLFLAMKGVTWLTENAVKGVSDISGLTHLGAARAEISVVGLSEKDVRHQIDKHQVAAGNGPVNVLVVVPPDEPPTASPPHATGISIPYHTGPFPKRAKVAQSLAGYHGSKWVWKSEVEPVYSLANNRMFFVNRDLAVQQLQGIHRRNYYRAVKDSGPHWVIPIADNVVGMGKSSFGNHYIQKCRVSWKGAGQDDFQKTLGACRTVHITFDRGDLLKPSLDAIMVRRLIMKLCEMFEKPPGILLNPPQDVATFLEDLTDEVGPLFIVLDEIGAAFEADNSGYLDSREHFMKFCLNIVGKWFMMKNVFFVFLGRGSFLSYVRMRPAQAQLVQSPFTISRLSIHLLRPEAIKTIMEKTFVDNVENKTIKEVCGLDGSQLDDVVQHLFQQTCGHPRTLLMAFETCRSFSELMEYNQPVNIEDWTLFYGELKKYREHASKLLDIITRGECADLTRQVEYVGEGQISLDVIANNCCIAWEGTVEQAKLYATPFILQLILQYYLPFQDYIHAIAGNNFSIENSTVFEWICLKRFQEMFSSARILTDGLPEYFNQSQAFGMCSHVSFNGDTRPIPKITDKGMKHPKLDSPTADPSAWPLLLQMIEADMRQNMATSICLKPLSKSSSSDALLMTQTDDIILTLGLAVKIFRSAEFCEAHLRKECNVFFFFNCMFLERRNMQKRLNVLVVCATKYNKTLSDKFDTRKSVSVPALGYPFIQEVILLNLSTPSNRARFFGIWEDPVLSKELEVIISKVEVDFFEKS